MSIIKNFAEIRNIDIPMVGGKNASLGEMFSQLSSQGILIPDGFAITSDGYWKFIKENNLLLPITKLLSELDTKNFSNLSLIADKIRQLILQATLSNDMKDEIISAYHSLEERTNENIS